MEVAPEQLGVFVDVNDHELLTLQVLGARTLEPERPDAWIVEAHTDRERLAELRDDVIEIHSDEGDLAETDHLLGRFCRTNIAQP